MHGSFSWTQADGRWMTREERPWALAFFALLVFILIVNPVGYMGGAWDDWQYLNAARCWVENGPCLPGDHWQGRWPVIAPLALSTGFLGESRFAVGLPYLLIFSLMSAGLVLLGNRLAGRPIGWMLATFTLSIPYVGFQVLQPAAEFIELLLVIIAFLAILAYGDRPRLLWPVAAGLAMGLAFQVRETSIILAAPLGLVALRMRPKPAHLLWAAAAFLAPLLVELAVYALTTGDPLYRRRLSLGHTSIPSTELRGEVSEGSPFFNRELIANWRHQPGFRVHWSIDGLLNLFVNGAAGISLLLNLAIAPFAWRRLEAKERRLAWRAIALFAYVAFMIIYVFAIDPKPRMLLAGLMASCLLLALQVHALMRSGSALLGTIAAAAAILMGAAGVAMQQQMWIVEEPVGALVERRGGQIEIDENSRRHLALVEGIETLPNLSSDAPELLIKIDTNCRRWPVVFLERPIELLGEYPMSSIPRHPTDSGNTICHYRYVEPISPEAILAAKSPPPADRDPYRGFEMLQRRAEDASPR